MLQQFRFGGRQINFRFFFVDLFGSWSLYFLSCLDFVILGFTGEDGRRLVADRANALQLRLRLDLSLKTIVFVLQSARFPFKCTNCEGFRGYIARIFVRK